MSTSQAQEFLSAFLDNGVMQEALKTRIIADRMLTFDHWQYVASVNNYDFSEADFDTALNADPSLMVALENLAEESNILQYIEFDFELSEEELATIVGGSCVGPQPSSSKNFK